MVTSLKNEAIKLNETVTWFFNHERVSKTDLYISILKSLGLKIKLNVGLVWLIYFIFYILFLLLQKWSSGISSYGPYAVKCRKRKNS